MKKKEVIVTPQELNSTRFPDCEVTIPVLRLFVNMDIPSEPDEIFRDAEWNIHFIKYL